MQRSLEDLAQVSGCDNSTLAEEVANEAVLAYALLQGSRRLQFRDFLVHTGAILRFRELLSLRLTEQRKVVSTDLLGFDDFETELS